MPYEARPLLISSKNIKGCNQPFTRAKEQHYKTYLIRIVHEYLVTGVDRAK